MTVPSTSSPDEEPRPFRVAVLDYAVATDLDPLPVRAIYARHDLKEAEALICTALEDIARRLSLLTALHGRAELDRMKPLAASLETRARALGLGEVALAAGHVGVCAGQRGTVALSAVLLRLERAFDAAISDIWALRDAP